jgi:hypothetical protein
MYYIKNPTTCLGNVLLHPADFFLSFLLWRTSVLVTVIYCFIVVYSFYCDLKEVKSTRDRPDTSVSPAYENVTSTGHSTSQRAIPVLREREKHIHDVRTHTAPNFHVTSSSNITSHRPPAIPPQTEHTYADVQKRPVLNNLRSDAVKSEEGEVNVVIEHVLPAKFSGTNHFNWIYFSSMALLCWIHQPKCQLQRQKRDISEIQNNLTNNKRKHKIRNKISHL